MTKPTLIAADSRLFLDGLCRILENDFDILGTAENGVDLVNAAQRSNPDLVLTEIAIPILNGIDACRQLCKARPSSKVIIVTMQSDTDSLRESFRAGASAYILKRCSSEELLKAVHSVLNGCSYVTPLITKQLVSVLDSSGSRRTTVLGLTDRQRQILQLVAEGLSLKQMGRVLHISPRTVEFHKSSLTRALNLRSTADLTRYAIEHGSVLSSRDPWVPVSSQERAVETYQPHPVSIRPRDRPQK